MRYHIRVAAQGSDRARTLEPRRRLLPVKSRWLVGVLWSGFLLLAVACSGRTGPENVYIAGEEDSGRTVSLRLGDALQVMLQANESTGYAWSVVTNDETVLQLRDAPTYEVDGDAEGASGETVFLFDAVGPGTSRIQMVYAFQEEGAVDPDRTFELSVEVVE